MSDTTRRAVLAGAAGLTATAVLAACGDSSTSASSGDPTTAAADPTTGAPAGTTASAGAPTSAAASSGLAKTTDIPAGGGKIFAAKDTVITQPTAGTFKAFTATCTHQQCPVSNVSGGTINCTCHGSKYKITDGSVANGPATKGLTPKTVTVTGDDIAVS
jgi:nitrite reductase/ring-hydroxylating ferredoxin subunit